MPAQAQRMSSLLALDKEFAPCRVERRACAMRGERAWGDGSASGVHGEGPRLWGGRARGGAHVEHVPHVRDLGRVEAERLVERRRVLPSRKRGITMRGEGRGAGGGRVVHCSAYVHCGGVSSVRRARAAERTANMPLMSLTLDVLRLSGRSKADALCRVEMRA